MSSSKIGVVGAGIMGAGIAEVAALSGHEVVLRSRTESSAKAAAALIEKSLEKKAAKGTVSPDDAKAALERITTTSDFTDLHSMDIVLESVVEDMQVKAHIFAELDRSCQESTILATNTSTLPVVELAMATGRPQQVCGIHFFNPASVMSLVELVRPITASEETMTAAREFAESCGKQPVEVKDQAGFIVNALLFPYLNNAIKLLEQGIASKEDIDTAMKGGCGFPMGPFALLDLVGLDTSLAILEALYAEYGDPNYSPAPLLKRMVAAEMLGRKSGKGFYDYHRS
jgi:3-hydroxybutyryl-CoA dehydrogenase